MSKNDVILNNEIKKIDRKIIKSRYSETTCKRDQSNFNYLIDFIPIVLEINN